MNQQPDQLSMDNAGFRDSLTKATTDNLIGLETYFMPYVVDGIPLLRMYTYELVQFLNRVWLERRIQQSEKVEQDA